MAKRLLIMALVAVQSASLSGASLFLCFHADGSIHLDGGPDCCVCLADEHGIHECAPCCHGQDFAASPGIARLENSPCRSEHVQITQSLTPTIVKKADITINAQWSVDFYSLPMRGVPIAHNLHPVTADTLTGNKPPPPLLAALIVSIAVQTV